MHRSLPILLAIKLGYSRHSEYRLGCIANVLLLHQTHMQLLNQFNFTLDIMKTTECVITINTNKQAFYVKKTALGLES